MSGTGAVRKCLKRNNLLYQQAYTLLEKITNPNKHKANLTVIFSPSFSGMVGDADVTDKTLVAPTPVSEFDVYSINVCVSVLGIIYGLAVVGYLSTVTADVAVVLLSALDSVVGAIVAVDLDVASFLSTIISGVEVVALSALDSVVGAVVAVGSVLSTVIADVKMVVPSAL